MNEWGLPDWRDARTYGETTVWSRTRWRWEFARRREEVRIAFNSLAKPTFDWRMRTAEAEGSTSRPLHPDEPGFITSPLEYPLFGFEALPNPAISAQPHKVLDFCVSALGRVTVYPYEAYGGRTLPVDNPDQLTIVFDLSQPLADQLEDAKTKLEKAQRSRFGKKIVRRLHPAKLLIYLRVLDAREAGASWAQISAILPDYLRSGKDTARNVWEQARGVSI
jgi:hypothetical protein